MQQQFLELQVMAHFLERQIQMQLLQIKVRQVPTRLYIVVIMLIQYQKHLIQSLIHFQFIMIGICQVLWS
jgi:hypothetical protein